MKSQQVNDLRIDARRFVSRIGSMVSKSQQSRILMYHRVCNSSHRLAVTPDLFRQHLDLFEGMGLEVLSVADLVARRNEPNLKAIALSFDDGYPEMATLVAPELKSRGMGATFYVLPRFATEPVVISPEAEWEDGGAEFLSHEQIKWIDRQGFEIASHGMTHRLMPELPDESVRRELLQSRQELEAVLGHRVRGFAYPRGAYLLKYSAMLLEAEYDYAVTVDPGHLGSGSPEFLLPRTEVAGGDDLVLLRNKLAGGLDLWHSSLQAGNNLKKMMNGSA